MTAAPRLTIGLPVRDGARYLPAAIDSIRRQTFSDFELIISDNASVDATAEISRQAAAEDSRIHYHRFDENVGASRNFNFVLQQAGGELFKWAAHDDVCAYAFLKTCIDGLDEDRSRVLVHTATNRVDSQDNVLGRYESEASFDDNDPSDRFGSVILRRHFCWPIFGVMRTSIVKQTAGIGSYVGSDRNLLAELALRGKIVVLPEVLFYRRDHPDSSVRRIPDEQARLAWFDPQQSGRRSYPTWRRLEEYAGAIQYAPLTVTQKHACLRQLQQWIQSPHPTGPTHDTLLRQEAVASDAR